MPWCIAEPQELLITLYIYTTDPQGLLLCTLVLTPMVTGEPGLVLSLNKIRNIAYLVLYMTLCSTLT